MHYPATPLVYPSSYLPSPSFSSDKPFSHFYPSHIQFFPPPTPSSCYLKDLENQRNARFHETQKRFKAYVINDSYTYTRILSNKTHTYFCLKCLLIILQNFGFIFFMLIRLLVYILFSLFRPLCSFLSSLQEELSDCCSEITHIICSLNCYSNLNSSCHCNISVCFSIPLRFFDCTGETLRYIASKFFQILTCCENTVGKILIEGIKKVLEGGNLACECIFGMIAKGLGPICEGLGNSCIVVVQCLVGIVLG